RLAPNQFSEMVDIIIDGKPRGSIVLDRSRPQTYMTITMPPGRYSYTATSVTTLFDEGTNSQETYSGTGQGIIEVAEGKQYELRESPSGPSTWQVTLMELP